jgi:putative DNA primase/helicase
MTHSQSAKDQPEGNFGHDVRRGRKRHNFRLLTPDELLQRPDPQWRVKGVLLTCGLAAIYGPSAVSKSFLAIDLACAIASDEQWFGHRIQNCAVTYCALEAEAGIPSRFRAQTMGTGRTPTEIRVRILLQEFNLLDADAIEDLAAAILTTNGRDGVVIIDTLNRAAPGVDENDSRGMGLIIANAKKLQTQVGGLLILVHHAGKDATKGLRGHSSLLAALDTVIAVERQGDNRKWTLTKSKDGKDGEAHIFRLGEITLGKDADGDDVSSCVVVPLEGESRTSCDTLRPNSRNQGIVKEVIFSMLEFASHTGQGGSRPGTPCVKYGDAMVAARGQLHHVLPKRQAERAAAAIEALIKRGLIELKDGWIWRR